MIDRPIVSRDDGIYEAFPDVALSGSGRLVCAFSECPHQLRRRLRTEGAHPGVRLPGRRRGPAGSAGLRLGAGTGRVGVSGSLLEPAGQG